MSLVEIGTGQKRNRPVVQKKFAFLEKHAMDRFTPLTYGKRSNGDDMYTQGSNTIRDGSLQQTSDGIPSMIIRILLQHCGIIYAAHGGNHHDQTTCFGKRSAFFLAQNKNMIQG